MGHEPPSLDWLSWCAEAEPSALELLAVDDHRVRAASKIETLDPLTGKPASTPLGSGSEWWIVEAQVNHNGVRLEIAIDPGRFKREAATIRRTGGVIPDQSALAVGLHRQLMTDLFITSDEAMLRRRWTPHEWVAVVSPLEAEEIVRSSLRARGRVLLRPTHGGVMHVDFHPYASDCARAMMPATHSALRSTLAPGRQDADDAMATLLEALLVRQADLIRATQYLEELDYKEGYFGGSGFTLLDHQMYHFQNALVLASGSLDILAQVLLACCSGELDRNKISWPKLVDPKSELRQILRANQSLGATRTFGRAELPLLRLAYKLRDTFQHRHSLRAALGAVIDEGGHYAWNKGCMMLDDNVDMDWLEKHIYASHHPIAGLIDVEEDLCVQPARFIRALTVATAAIAETAIEVEAWPGSDWTGVSHAVIDARNEREARTWP